MTYFIHRQRNLFSCGPVAILNALKWAGRGATYDSHYGLLVRECKTDVEGTHDKDLRKTLRKYGFKFKKTRLLQDIKDHLEDGGAMILSHLDSDGEWHYSFWYAHRFNRYHGANIDMSKDLRSVTEYRMKRYLFDTDDLKDLPEALLLTKQST